VSEFDAYHDSYRQEVARSIRFIRQDWDYFTAAKARALLDLAGRTLGEPKRLSALDVGCGVGHTARFLKGRFKRLYGVDPSASSVERARDLNPEVEYRVGDGRRLPFENGSMDLVFAICVMHHVPPEDRPQVAREMARVAKPNGVVAVFEHNPINPLTRRAVSNCRFDADAELLSKQEAARTLEEAGLQPLEARYIVFLPFGGQRLAAVERLLARVPLGAQHFVAARSMPSRAAAAAAGTEPARWTVPLSSDG